MVELMSRTATSSSLRKLLLDLHVQVRFAKEVLEVVH